MAEYEETVQKAQDAWKVWADVSFHIKYWVSYNWHKLCNLISGFPYFIRNFLNPVYVTMQLLINWLGRKF